jgi:hypothetical protein
MSRTIYTDKRHPTVRVYLDEIKDGRAIFFPQGGGFGHSVPAADWHEFFVPAPAPVFAPGRVTGDWLDDGSGTVIAFPAYLNGERWNGWAMPYFTKETALDMLTASGNTFRFDDARDAFIISEPEAYDGEDYVIEAEQIDVNGERVKVYAVGAGCWVWDEVTDDKGDA